MRDSSSMWSINNWCFGEKSLLELKNEFQGRFFLCLNGRRKLALPALHASIHRPCMNFLRSWKNSKFWHNKVFRHFLIEVIVVSNGVTGYDQAIYCNTWHLNCPGSLTYNYMCMISVYTYLFTCHIPALLTQDIFAQEWSLKRHQPVRKLPKCWANQTSTQ